MAHSYVDFRETSFRTHDLDLTIACILILEKSNAVANSKLQPMFKHWMESLTTGGSGCIDLELDRYLTDTDSIEMLAELIDSVDHDLANETSEFCPKEKLNLALAIAKIHLANDYKVALIKDVLHKLRSLVKPNA